MRIISNKALLHFSSIHPSAHTSLQKWRRRMESIQFVNFADIKRVFHTTDKVGSYYVFNVGGNKYRIIAEINFPHQMLYVQHIFTHQEYNKWKP